MRNEKNVSTTHASEIKKKIRSYYGQNQYYLKIPNGNMNFFCLRFHSLFRPKVKYNQNFSMG